MSVAHATFTLTWRVRKSVLAKDTSTIPEKAHCTRLLNQGTHYFTIRRLVFNREGFNICVLMRCLHCKTDSGGLNPVTSAFPSHVNGALDVFGDIVHLDGGHGDFVNIVCGWYWSSRVIDFGSFPFTLFILIGFTSLCLFGTSFGWGRATDGRHIRCVI